MCFSLCALLCEGAQDKNSSFFNGNSGKKQGKMNAGALKKIRGVRS